MTYKTIASFKYRGQTISVREERANEESTPVYLLYEGRCLYISKKEALSKMLSAIHEFCHI